MPRDPVQRWEFVLVAVGLLGCAQGVGLATSGILPDAHPDAARDAHDDVITLVDASGDDATTSDARDGGADATRRDAATPPECVADRDCDDGVACNGLEVCSDGECVAGTAVDCNDGVACTIDMCREPAGTCMSTPSDALCPDGQACSEETGCVAGCLESPCRLVSPQCGCAEGKGCYLTPDGSRSCADEGYAWEGEDCYDVNDCEAGLACVSLDEAGTAARCGRFCNVDSDCESDASLCILQISDGAEGTIRDVDICSRDCDPVWQTGCPWFSNCTVFEEATGPKRLFTDCQAPVGFGWQGDACATSEDCDSGFLCLDPDGDAPSFSARCMHWCDVMTSDGCDGGTFCFAFAEPLVVNGYEYGVCG